MSDAVAESLVNLRLDEVRESVERALKSGEDAEKVLEAINEGAGKVGQLFEEGRYFLSELIVAGQIMKEAMSMIKPHLKSTHSGGGTIVLGTIEGDIHDIGKDIVTTLLTSAGFNVRDLGVDVSARRFAEATLESQAKVVAISVLFSVAALNLAGVVDELQKVGVRDKIKIIVGGAAARQEYIGRFGIDAAVNDAVKGIDIIKDWMSKMK